MTWFVGENVTTTFPNGDGSIRDMYKPECFFHPSTTVADYYSCTTYADGGGVHKNSGVLNRLYSVLTDGGEYADPTSTDGSTLTINALGFVKSTNLFWRTHQELNPTSQYMDLALTLQGVCEDNIGLPLYFPNVFNSTIITSTETLTTADCDNVAQAILGSGMGDTSDFCPNIACVANNPYDCMWVNCSASSTVLFYEVCNALMGLNELISSLFCFRNMITTWATMHRARLHQSAAKRARTVHMQEFLPRMPLILLICRAFNSDTSWRARLMSLWVCTLTQLVGTLIGIPWSLLAKQRLLQLMQSANSKFKL